MRSLMPLQLFVWTVDAGSLSAAARRLDLTPAAASAALKRLEAELGAPLLLRSTRKQRLTPEGELFLAQARQALDLLAAARDTLQSGRAEVQGTLQMSVPSDLGRHVLLPWLDEFMALHPRLRLRLQISDRWADVLGQPVDVAIRYGTPPDSSLVALPLLPEHRRILVASPDYLARHGVPAHPAELSRHNCLAYMLGDQVHQHWRFTRDGQEETVPVKGDRVADDGEVVRLWAVAGHGIAYKSHVDACVDLWAGRLVHVCPDWLGESAPLQLMCADRRQLSPAIRLLRDFLGDRLARHLHRHLHPSEQDA